MSFSTQSGRALGRPENWRASVSPRCAPPQAASNDFRANAELRRVGRFACARITQSAGETSCTWRTLGATDAAHYLVFLQLRGTSRLEQAGRAASLGPGDLTLIDSSLPTRLRFEHKNIQLSLDIPKRELDAESTLWSRRLAVVLSRPRSTLVSTLMCSAFEASSCVNDEQANAVSDAVVRLLATGWSGNENSKLLTEGTSHEALLRAARQYVGAHLEDEDLGPRLIATECGVSERQLHRIFQSSGQSVGHLIRHSRLDRCALDLRDASQRHRTIAEIAFHWGFNDAGHFSRLFHTEFEQTPSRYRAAAFGTTAYT